MTKKYSISFVIPVYKSEKSLAPVVNEISKIKDLDWEAVLVNDNSPDNVKEVILELIKKYPYRITYLEFRKNYGQHVAIVEGFKHVTKEYVATIDDDGQNPPKEVLKMMKVMLENDYDVVYGALKKRKHSFVRKLLSKVNNLISTITIGNKDKIPTSNVRLMKYNFAKSISSSYNRYNYLEGLIFSLTNHIGFIYINHVDRLNGKSTYSFSSLIKLWLNHIIGYSNVFIKSITILSFFISLLSFIIGLTYLLVTINEPNRPLGWLSVYLTVTFQFSINFFILGILIEYIGRIYLRINQNNEKIIIKQISV